MEVNRRSGAVTHSAAGRLRRPRVDHRSRLRDGLQIPASSLLPGGARVVRLAVAVAPGNLVKSAVLPGADAVEPGVAGFGGDQGL